MERDLLPSGYPRPLPVDLTCPHCGEVGSAVVGTRGAIYHGRRVVRRRRRCGPCGERFSTLEICAERAATDGRVLVPDEDQFRAAVRREAVALLRKLIEEMGL